MGVEEIVTHHHSSSFHPVHHLSPVHHLGDLWASSQLGCGAYGIDRHTWMPPGAGSPQLCGWEQQQAREWGVGEVLGSNIEMECVT